MKKWMVGLAAVPMLWGMGFAAHAQETAPQSISSFAADVMEAVNYRYEQGEESITNYYMNHERADLPEIRERYAELARGEWELLKDYDTAQLESQGETIDSQHVQKTYLEGVKLQMEAADEGNDFEEQWQQGYRQRIRAIYELMRNGYIPETEQTSQWSKFYEDEMAEIMEVQAALGCTADGEFGKGTKAAIEQYRTEQGLPAGSYIDDELIMRLLDGEGTETEET